MALGEKQQITAQLAATPISVIEDSRCPIEAECVWQGRVVVEAEIELGEEIASVTLDSSEPLRINAGLLSIAEVAPEASIAWAKIAPENYRFAFNFVPSIMERDDSPTSIQ